MTTKGSDALGDAALRDSERFRSVADAAPAMLWVTERNGECSFVSRGWRDFTGQDEAKGRGSGWLDALHAEERASVEAAFAAANEILDGLSAQSEDFKTIYDSQRAFRNEGYLWFQVAEFTYDNFMIRNRS